MPTLAAIKPVGFTLVEAPDSPQYSFTDKPTLTRTWNGTWSAISALATATAIGSMTGSWRVKEVLPVQATANTGKLVIKYEAAGSGSGATLPLDKFSLRSFEINPRLERHPRYASLDDDTMALVRQAVDGADQTTRDEALTAIGLLSAPVANLASELVGKLLRGQETYYLAGLTYIWSASSWSVPTFSDGGVIETPGGPLAAYIATFPFDWLRLCDELDDTDGTSYRITRSWKGGPSGHWDSDLY